MKSWLRKNRVGRGDPVVLARPFALEVDWIGVVHQSVQNGVRDRGIGDGFVPLVDGKLVGDEGQSLPLAFVEDLQQLAIALARGAGDASL